MDRWRGKVVLITGISQGIGKAIAKKLLEKGLKVIGCDERQDQLQEVERELSRQGEFKAIACDVTQDNQVQKMFQDIKNHYGGVDICINNAAVSKKSNILNGKPNEWQKIFDVNVLGLLRVTKEAVEQMKNKGNNECHIINIGSICGHLVPAEQISEGSAVYCASKFAVTALTEGLRQELQKERTGAVCKVSQISPALVDTQMTKERKTDSELLKPEDVAEAVVMLLSLPQRVQVQDIILRCTQQSS